MARNFSSISLEQRMSRGNNSLLTTLSTTCRTYAINFYERKIMKKYQMGMQKKLIIFTSAVWSAYCGVGRKMATAQVPHSSLATASSPFHSISSQHPLTARQSCLALPDSSPSAAGRDTLLAPACERSGEDESESVCSSSSEGDRGVWVESSFPLLGWNWSLW